MQLRSHRAYARNRDVVMSNPQHWYTQFLNYAGEKVTKFESQVRGGVQFVFDSAYQLQMFQLYREKILAAFDNWGCTVKFLVESANRIVLHVVQKAAGSISTPATRTR